MKIPKSPYISRIRMKNFRNFKDVDAQLNHKQIIIGENNVGKTNFIRALRLILDPTLNDEDRFLLDSDFHEGIEEPMKNNEVIEISIELRGFEHNKTILSVLDGASVNFSPPTLRLTYRYFPKVRDDGNIDYQYIIFQGENEDKPFNHYHRRFLNMSVIDAIRDVESELKNSRKSPISKLIKQYDIRKEELEEIANSLKEKSDEVLSIDELVDLTNNISSRFSDIIGKQVDSKVSLETVEIDPNRILNTLKLLVGENRRHTSETSLGINNILYITLVLYYLEDKTIPSVLKNDVFTLLLSEEGSEVLRDSYDLNSKNNYILKNEISDETLEQLYGFMDTFHSSSDGFTILAIEEPESHLHPALQRVIYKDVMKKNTSIIMTTHSPHITSVAPIESIVHLRPTKSGTHVNTTANLKLEPRDRMDLERYLDIKRGEIYFGRGVILVEGVAEEYLIPRFAEELGKGLDKKGIICCNVNSTNFEPYVKFLASLGIPYVVITDGDYYILIEGEDGVAKKFGIACEDEHDKYGYDGNDRISKLVRSLKLVERCAIPIEYAQQDEFFEGIGFFIGVHTMEIDMMESYNPSNTAENIFINIFNELTFGGEKQRSNFKKDFEIGNYHSCLNKIEGSHSQIGKGRFAQQLSIFATEDMIPSYIANAINKIYSKVDEI